MSKKSFKEDEAMKTIRRYRKKNGVALIIALFTVFAILTMGVAYIGISYTNSRASAGLEKEAMAVGLANAGVEYAINWMGDPHHWGGIVALNPTASDVPVGPLKVRVSALAATDEFFDTPHNQFERDNSRVIETMASLPALGITSNSNPGLYGQWRILVLPEAGDSVTVAGCGTAFQYNVNFRVICRARILSGSDPSVAKRIASREVLARVSNEFPGSIYQNIRSYDAAGGFHYPNRQECTADAVFVAENFTWDGGIRIDGANPDTNMGMPQNTATFDRINGWVPPAQDVSGSLNIDTLGNLPVTKSDQWPKFNGKVLTNKNNVGVSPAGSNGNLGINFDNGDSAMNTNRNQVFTYVKDPYQTGIPTLNISDSIWRVDNGTTQGFSKLNFIDGNDLSTATAHDGYFNGVPAGSGNGKWHIEIGDDELIPDISNACEKVSAPTIRITVSPQTDGKTKFFVQKMQRSDASGELEVVQSPPSKVINTSFTSDEADWQKLIYIKGGNVQIVGGGQGDSTLPTPPNVGDGDPGAGHLTVPATVVADSNPTRDLQSYRAAQNRTTYNPANGIYDGRLTSANVWDSQTGTYVYQCYNDNGSRLLGDVDKQIPIWLAGTEPLQLVRDTPSRYSYRFPPVDQSVNEQPEGNLSVISDLTYKKNMESPSLGLLAKNHVFLNDYKHDSTYSDPADRESSAKSTLDLNATIGSENHSMQMDFFNFNHNPYLKPLTVSADTPPPGGKAQTFLNVPMDDAASALANIPTQYRTQVNGKWYVNKYAVCSPQVRTQLWWDYAFGADQPALGTPPQSLPALYQKGTFRFKGCIISRFADVEADADSANSGMGYTNQNLSYDANLKNRSAPFFSTACYDKSKARAALSWSILSYVDKGAITETINNL
jgi:hypothetical protein